MRELRNAIESAVILSQRNTIEIDDLPEHFRPEESAASFLKINMPSSMDAIQKEAIKFTLQFTNGNKSKTAELLEMNRKTLYSKLNEYDLK